MKKPMDLYIGCLVNKTRDGRIKAVWNIGREQVEIKTSPQGWGILRYHAAVYPQEFVDALWIQVADPADRLMHPLLKEQPYVERKICAALLFRHFKLRERPNPQEMTMLTMKTIYPNEKNFNILPRPDDDIDPDFVDRTDALLVNFRITYMSEGETILKSLIDRRGVRYLRAIFDLGDHLEKQATLNKSSKLAHALVESFIENELTQ